MCVVITFLFYIQSLHTFVHSSQPFAPLGLRGADPWHLATMLWTRYRRVERQHQFSPSLSFLAVALFVRGGRAAETKQPLPPNTGLSLVADVAGTTVANDTFWAEHCKTIPQDAALFIVVDMGAVRDLFKPVEGSTFCQMLQSNDRHQWSYDGVEWATPGSHANDKNNGGSVNYWPRDKGRAGDNRIFLSYWGIEHGSLTGGCCSTSTAKIGTTSALRSKEAKHKFWGQPCT